MSLLRIIGPIFFYASITKAAYMEIITTFVYQLDDVELSIGYFQQDGATSHTSHASIAEIKSFRKDCMATALTRSDAAWLFLVGDVWKGQFTKTNHEP